MKILRMPQEIRDRELTDDYILLKEIEPVEFLRLASRSSLGNAQPFRPECVSKWESWLWLAIDPQAGVVLAHEGRHRAESLQFSGYDLVEVEIWLTPDPRRFDGNLERMLKWRWRGRCPEWQDLAREEEWIIAIGRRMGVSARRVYAEKARRAMMAAVMRNLMGV